MKFLLILSVIGFVSCDKLPNKSGPYPASGWRPQGATLQLPNEYGPPQRQQAPNVEITKEQVQFVGQVSGQISETTTNPSNEYLPPDNDETTSSDDILKVQGLPRDAPAGAFNGQYNQLNSGEFLPFRAGINNQQRQGQFRPQSVQTNGRIQIQPNVNRQQFIPFQQQAQFQQQQQIQFQPQPQQPAVFNEYLPPPSQQYPVPSQSNPESESDIEDDDTEGQGPSVSIANSATNGQYYILGDDNTLQKVIYMTSQTEDDKQTNGYTAQLRYAPVEPIRDPVYAYDDQGHLVKIFNKK